MSDPEANERGSSLIGRRTHYSSKGKGLRSKEQGIVVMREWRNRPFPSSRLRPLQRESKCEVFVMQISFHSYLK